MMNAKIQDAFDRQLNAELYSSYLYLSMSAYFESKDLAGMANWMRIQAQEELLHAMKFFDFINERDGRVELMAVAAPKKEWESPLHVFQESLEHEQKVTALINDLVDLALGEKDHATNTFLQWFVTEQVEEEASARTIVEKLKMVGSDAAVLFMLDGELGRRVLTTPPAAAT